MEESSPSIQEWRNLYQAAIEFKKLGSWDWMFDSDMFGVQNPDNGEIGYCCILGNLGEVFGLIVYLGTDGLEGCVRLQSGEIPTDEFALLTSQKCLELSFEDRRFLDKRDLQVINDLGLKFRGRNSWPLFRDFCPGCYPWYLTNDEAKYLALALQQAIGVSLRFKKNPDMLIPPEEDQFLVRVPEREGETLRWRDEWLKPPPLEKVRVVGEPVDESRLDRIKGASSGQKIVWEMDFFYLPRPVREGEERPYFPYVSLCVDHYSGLILDADVAQPSKHASQFLAQFLDNIAGVKSLPKEILVRREEVFQLFEPVSSRLGINLRLVKRLAAVEKAQAGMEKSFRQQSRR